MNEKLRILITGFGPFPGAPFNPTEPLVARLLRLRRPALDDVELSGHIFPVTYSAVDRELPELLRQHQVSESVQWRESQHEEHHQRAVQRQQRKVELGRHHGSPDRDFRVDQVETHEQ